MAAPTLQAEGALSVNTTGANSPTIPSHVADDILFVASGYWGPNTTGGTGAPAPSGWAEPSGFSGGIQVRDGIDNLDGVIQAYWKRAAGPGETITISRGTGWDGGNDTAWGCRAYVIRGCTKQGEPWDEFNPTGALTAANGAVDAVTVLGVERLVVQFLVRTDDYVTAPTLSGWTTGTQVESTTGTDHSQASHRKDNVSASTSADTSTTEAPAQGFYAFMGVSFKPQGSFVYQPSRRGRIIR